MTKRSYLMELFDAGQEPSLDERIVSFGPMDHSAEIRKGANGRDYDVRSLDGAVLAFRPVAENLHEFANHGSLHKLRVTLRGRD